MLLFSCSFRNTKNRSPCHSLQTYIYTYVCLSPFLLCLWFCLTCEKLFSRLNYWFSSRSAHLNRAGQTLSALDGNIMGWPLFTSQLFFSRILFLSWSHLLLGRTQRGHSLKIAVGGKSASVGLHRCLLTVLQTGVMCKYCTGRSYQACEVWV